MTRTALEAHVMRGAVSTVMALTFFWGLARIPMAQAIAHGRVTLLGRSLRDQHRLMRRQAVVADPIEALR